MWDFWENWFRRRDWLFREMDREFERFFREMDREIERFLSQLPKELPKELLREYKLPDGSVVRTYGPVVRGYSITVGPDGKPSVRVFGNRVPLEGAPALEMKREPLVECIPGPKHIRVVAELPGVSRSDIDLRVEEDKLVISAERGEWKYHKEVVLPYKVDPKSADATFENGVLEVIFRRQEKPETGEKIPIKEKKEQGPEEKEKK
ncbi:MAG: Hsp20/alpha crystallin family protein [Hadesarchaea archaeon]|jgi:HSP20 family protein|nr:Hsp20/alpha crystallin family protein [Hadesarchaea archaeon]TDA33644.1 MAG: Hsp20/alpha crystallin family protein [Hadesarchaea archaeon]